MTTAPTTDDAAARAVEPTRPPRGPWNRLRDLRGYVAGMGAVQKWLIMGPAVLIVTYLALTPLAFLVWQALFEGGFTLDRLFRAGSAGSLARLIRSSLVFAGGTTLFALVVGATLAYIYERTDVPLRGLIFLFALIPLVIPNILYTISWIILASPRSGLLNDFFEGLVGARPLNIFSMEGMIWVEGANLSTVVFLLVAAALRSMDPSVEEAASVAGVRGAKLLRGVTLPLIAPAMAAASLLVAMRALGTFETPTLLGLPAGVFVFVSNIWLDLSRFPADIPGASGQSLWLLLVSGLLVYYYFVRFGGDKARRYQTISGKAFRMRRRELSLRMKWLLGCIVALWAFFALVLPVVTLVYVSLVGNLRLPTSDVLQSLSLDTYRSVLDSVMVKNAFRNSLVLSTVTATIVMGLMAIVSWFLTRTRVRGRWLIDAVSFTPLAIPSLVLGLALVIVYLRVPLPIYGTLTILGIAYVTKFLPHGIRYATPAVMQIGAELEEAAEMSGASWWRSFRKITVPLMMPGLVAGWVFIASISVRELGASLLLYTQGTEVLSISIWQLWEAGRTADVAALGVLIILALVTLVGVARLVGGRASLSSGG